MTCSSASHSRAIRWKSAGSDILAGLKATPEATTLTYSHAAFTARAVAFAPIDEPALVMLLDINSTLPLSVSVSFRQRLRLMWPAGLQTGNIGWNATTRVMRSRKRAAGLRA